MVKTASTMLPLGTLAPDFSLPNVDGRTVSLKDFKDAKGLVVAFICNHCPFVVHIRPEFAKFAREYQAKGIAVVGISSNDAVAFPADGPDKMKAEVESAGYTFPYLFDESQSVAKAYRELEHEGVIELRQGAGAFVSAAARAKKATDRLRAGQAEVAAAVERLRARGVTDEEIRRMFEAELAGVRKTGGHGE